MEEKDQTQEQPDEVQTETGQTLPVEDLPEDEMTKVERERAGVEPVEGEEDDSDDDKED